MPDPTRLLLLRHGEVASHHGDVPVTAAGLEHAERAGRALAAAGDEAVTVLSGLTRRTRETAEALIRGFDPRHVRGPVDCFALRNPDLYLAGTRVNLVSSPSSLADQVPGLDAGQVRQHAWWMGFLTAPDRIGWWLRHHDPPGETAADLARRVLRFAGSLDDPGPTQGRLVVGVTHSPLLRAVQLHATGHDPGEPGYLTGAVLQIGGGRVRVRPYDPLAADPL